VLDITCCPEMSKSLSKVDKIKYVKLLNCTSETGRRRRRRGRRRFVVPRPGTTLSHLVKSQHSLWQIFSSNLFFSEKCLDFAPGDPRNLTKFRHFESFGGLKRGMPFLPWVNLLNIYTTPVLYNLPLIA
jgi:hypothetical protein